MSARDPFAMVANPDVLPWLPCPKCGMPMKPEAMEISTFGQVKPVGYIVGRYRCENEEAEV